MVPPAAPGALWRLALFVVAADQSFLRERLSSPQLPPPAVSTCRPRPHSRPIPAASLKPRLWAPPPTRCQAQRLAESSATLPLIGSYYQVLFLKSLGKGKKKRNPHLTAVPGYIQVPIFLFEPKFFPSAFQYPLPPESLFDNHSLLPSVPCSEASRGFPTSG